MSESNEVPTYQPQAGLRERIARAIWEDDERAKRDESDDWDAKPLTDHEVYLANADAVLAVLPPQPATSPVPPWPGAVLSGLVDEDGVPTWLAQAWQVRGEQARCRSDLGWDDNDETGGYIAESWVEVRAPRAVPVPETERVPAVSALADGLMVNDGNGDFFCPSYARRNMDDSVSLVREDGHQAALVRPDGTVEVLKDGDR